MAPKQALNGSFSKPTGCFTQISNKILRDNSLSLKAKGLYALIYSYITLPNFTLYKNYLKSQCSEGRCAFDSSWKELVAAGYLKHTRTRLNNGTFAYQYELSSQASQSSSEANLPIRPTDQIPTQQNQTDRASAKGNTAKNHLEHTDHTKHIRHSVCLPSLPQSPLPTSINPINKKRANRCNADTNLKPTLKQESKLTASPYHPNTENRPPVSIYNNTIPNNTKSVSDLDTLLITQLKTQIDYDYFMADPAFNGTPRLIISILLDYLVELSSSNHLSNQNLLKTVDSCMINEFLEHMAIKQPENIRYPLPYWRKAFINYLKESALSLCVIC